MTPNFKGYMKNKTCALNYIFDVPIQNVGLNHVWISTQNIHCQSYMVFEYSQK